MKYFICDDTPESFFTAVFDAYTETECVITSEGNIQLALGVEAVRAPFDFEKSERVRRGLKNYAPYAENDILTALRSCDKRKEQVCFEYIKRIFASKKSVKNAFNLPEVVAFNDVLHKVTIEIHHMKGFLRFKEIAGGTLYAPYSPDNDITDLLMPHFVARFRAEKFIIHDIKRGIAGIFNGSGWITVCLDGAEICLSENERAFETLWKKYYNAVNIEARPHEKQMKGYMPVRYWKFLPEKN